MTGLMCPPVLHPCASLMALPARTGRGWMEPNPELPPLGWHDLTRLLWLLAGIGLLVAWAAILHGG